MQRFALCFVAFSTLTLIMSVAAGAQEADDQFDCGDFDPYDDEALYFEVRGKDSGIVRFTYEMLETLKQVVEEE